MVIIILAIGIISVAVSAQLNPSGSQTVPYAGSGHNASYARGLHYCGMPNVVPTIPIQPEKFLGTWYAYRNTVPSANMIINYNFIGNSWDLLTDRPAVNQWVTESYHKTPTTAKCDFYLWIGQVISYGVLSGVLAGTTMPDYVVNDVYFTLYIEYDNFYVKYKCGKANHQSGVCEQPIFLINTRVRWDKMDANVPAEIDRKVDTVLSKYCLSSTDVPRQTQGADLPDCPPVTMPFEARLYFKGMQVTSDQNPS